MPCVWGQAQTFGFSGLDGETDWFHPFVGQTLFNSPGILFHAGQDSSRDFELKFGGEVRGVLHDGKIGNTRPHVIGPDVIDLEIDLSPDSRVRFKLVWLDRVSVLGEARGENAIPLLITNGEVLPISDITGEGPAVISPEVSLATSGENTVVNLGTGNTGRFVVACGADLAGIVESALGTDLESVFAERLRFYENLPVPNTDDEEILRTFIKACAIMKVDVETACGEITNRWTTPDRWPHRHMWLWDSAFHSLGAQHLDPELGRDCIRAVLTRQRSDGFIPHTMAPDPRDDSPMTQPPVIAWATWELYSLNPDRGFLKEVYPGLKAYLEWDLANMDRLGTGLLQWQFPGPDSGMDNSPRFDDGADFDAVDLNCFAANECQRLELMAKELGLNEDAEQWRRRNMDLIYRINERLWNDEDGFYYDRRGDGSWVEVKTVDDFLPLFSGVANSRRATVLVGDHLMNSKEFWPDFPIPSVAINESKFELDMWRGPTWINYNSLIIHGLQRYGYEELAQELTKRTVRELCRWRAERSSIYEFYDPFGKTAPQDLMRKGRVRSWPGDGIPVISDFFWSSSFFVDIVSRSYGLSKR